MFSFPLGEPQGKDGNQKIRDKCKQYLDRVEDIQQYLVNKEVVTRVNRKYTFVTNMDVGVFSPPKKATVL